MKISKLEFIPVSIPYTHREVSSQIRRDGVTDVIVKATTDDGLIGWGESCSGNAAGRPSPDRRIRGSSASNSN